MKTQDKQNGDTTDGVYITGQISKSAREKLDKLKKLTGGRNVGDAITRIVDHADIFDIAMKNIEEERLKEVESRPPEVITQDMMEISDDLFTYIKNCMISASQKSRNPEYYDFDPNNITANSVKADLEKIIPSLFNPYALLSKDEMAAMVFGVGVRNEFNVETMDEFHNLKRDGLIKIIYNDYREENSDDGF